MIIEKEVYVSKYVDVDIEIEAEDVASFIEQASDDELEEIMKALYDRNTPTHLTVLDAATISHLINRANQFGLDDMLDELKREGERVGAYLKVEVKS